MFAHRPISDRARTAPRLDQISFRIELHHGGGRRAAFGAPRSQRDSFVGFGERARALEDPDVVLSVHGHAADLPQDPIVRQLLRPRGVELELRRAFGGDRLRAGDDGHTGEHRGGKHLANGHVSLPINVVAEYSARISGCVFRCRLRPHRDCRRCRSRARGPNGTVRPGVHRCRTCSPPCRHRAG